jgi:V8-like Glu-specific endopeptidase
MKIPLKLLLLPLLLLFSLFLNAQVSFNFNNPDEISDRGRFARSYKTRIDFEIPAKNIAGLLEKEKVELEKSKETKPFQLAEPVPVDIDIPALISWDNDINFAYGKFTIRVNGALSASINFNQFFLPKGTEMYIYNEKGNMISGVITENENNLNKKWGSWVYRGSLLTIEIRTPISTMKELILHANNIAYGYKEVYQTKLADFGTSGACEINVICPLGNAWVGERNSVALVLNDAGSSWCSGAMVMNTCSTMRPFFLTANHCFEGQDVSGWRFTFQAWSTSCPNPGTNSDGVVYNGSTLRANWSNSDFCLVELNNYPPSNSGITYAGWNRSNTAATSATGLHHPHGDVMKISQSDASLVRSGWGGAGTDHWQVFWSPKTNGLGQTVTPVTEGGSSGSPLFDQTHRIVGQLHGGPSVCSGSQLWDFYGSFDVSWTGGGTNTTRLSNWLDPNNSGATTTNTTNVSSLGPVPYDGYIVTNGVISLCSGTSYIYTLSTGLGSRTATWSVTPSTAATIQVLAPSGQVVRITPTTTNTNIPAVVSASIVNACPALTLSADITVIPNTPLPYTCSDVGNGVCQQYVCYPAPGYPLQLTIPNSALPNTNSWHWHVTDGVFQGNVTDMYVPWNMASYNIVYPNNNATCVVWVRPVTSCNAESTSEPFKWIIGSYICRTAHGSFSVLPNPASSVVTITLEDNDKDATTVKTGFSAIEIYDKMGIIKKRNTYAKGSRNATIDVSTLPPDYYVLRIFNGTAWEEYKILIAR